MNKKIIIGMLLILSSLFAGEGKWLTVGSLHNFYMSNGCEVEHGLIAEQQAGFRYPAFFPNQDMQAAKGLWIGIKNFKDPGKIQPDGSYYEWSEKVVFCGPRSTPGNEESVFMPVKHKMYAASELPVVTVENIPANELLDLDNYDEIDDNGEYCKGADRYIYNEVVTSAGITMKRNLYSFSHPIYGKMIFHDYVFVNTGHYALEDGEPVMVDLNKTDQNLEDVYFSWQFRNALTLEGANGAKDELDWRGRPGWGGVESGNMRWGRNTLNDALGENQDVPQTESQFDAKDTDPAIGVDVAYDANENLRCILSWHGKHSATVDGYDNIGAPNYNGYENDGRLGAWQYMGVATIHADNSNNDKSDNINQPTGTKCLDSDAEIAKASINVFNAIQMTGQYEQISAGHPEKSHAEQVGTGFADNFYTGGGSSSLISYGPYDMSLNDSIRIVFVEAADGIKRSFVNGEDDPRFDVGNNWYKRVKDNETVYDLEYPDYASGTLKSIDLDSDENANLYKDAWVYTGRDSLLESFKHGIRLFREHDLVIPDDETAPVAPQEFYVEAFSDFIQLKWFDTKNMDLSRFEGYKIYRAVGDYKYNKFDFIGDINFTDGTINSGDNEFIFEDKTAVRGQKYFYTVVAYDNGDNAFNRVLTSNPHLTRTNIGASLVTPGASKLDNIRIVPNPWIERNETIQYAGNANKFSVLFVNLPDRCNIRIFNERGDLIKKLSHSKGSEERWNLATDYNQIISSGIYIIQVEALDNVYDIDNKKTISKGKVVNKKFVVIR